MSVTKDIDDLASEILEFWFSERVSKLWFERSLELDQQITMRFGETYEFAANGEFDDWSSDARSALALVILLDQFPRNMFRGSRRAFESDAKARLVASAALDAGYDEGLSAQERQFLYLPLMHSEHLADQEKCVTLFTTPDLSESLPFALEHRDIIARFGRFPHRNVTLGRENSVEETEFLKIHKGF
jgi:uncharacterized protein (DUF924 family)